MSATAGIFAPWGYFQQRNETPLASGSIERIELTVENLLALARRHPSHSQSGPWAAS